MTLMFSADEEKAAQKVVEMAAYHGIVVEVVEYASGGFVVSEAAPQEQAEVENAKTA